MVAKVNRRKKAMRLKLLISLVAFLLAGCEEKGDRAMQERYPADGPGAAVAVIRDGNVLYSRTFGLANLEHRITVSDETIFDGASIAKQFTAFAILTLAHEGHLKLDDEIDPYVSELLPSVRNKGITIRHLLNHTSGIRDYVWATTTAGRRFDDVHTSAHVERFLHNQNSLSHDPGVEWVYNNTGYFILGKIVTQKAEKSLAEFLAEIIFKPFGMTRTFFLEDPTQIIAHRADSYGPARGSANDMCYGLAPGAKQLVKCIDSTALPGPASLMTTLPDMTKWLLQINRGLSVGDPRFKQLFTISTSGARPTVTDCGPDGSAKAAYAAGMYVDEIGDVALACHGGTWRGFRALVVFVPKYKLSTVILSNRGNNLSFLRDASFALIKLYEPSLDLKVLPSNRPPQPQCEGVETGDLQGTYYSAELQMGLTFQLNSAGHFVATSSQRGSTRLCHDTRDSFINADDTFRSFASVGAADDDAFRSTSFWLTRAKFARNDSGQVTAVEISPFTAAENLVFVKLPQEQRSPQNH
jgi:CubicO group peptidase (beta-lactamase class C family)